MGIDKIEHKKKQQKVIDAMIEVKSLNDYFAIERAHEDQIKVKRMYIDMANDLVAGILLGQILYWFTPKKDGSLRVSIKHDGKLWLAKKREDWWNEVRITIKQFDRACQILEDKGLIETDIFRFAGSPTKHIRPNETKILQGVKSILTKGRNPNVSNGSMDVNENGKSNLTKDEEYYNTETTAETTPKTTTERESALTPDFITLYLNKEKDIEAQYVKLTDDDYEELEFVHGNESLWEAITDLENNIGMNPNHKKWKCNHKYLLQKYIAAAERKVVA